MTARRNDRNPELRALFFESAAELLQSLNEAGMALEKNPADEENLRSVRRPVHTLKGDSAACGLHPLSELAHQLEDILTPQIAQKNGPQLAEMVLEAADVFGAMLSAHQKNKRPPSAAKLHARIRALAEQHAGAPALAAGSNYLRSLFAWNEYEQLLISEALHRGEMVYNVALRIDPRSSMRSAAFQLIRNVLHGAGTVLALQPEDNAAALNAELVEAALASSHPMDWIEKRCRIPSIISDVHLELAVAAESPEHEMLAAILESQNTAQAGPENGSAAARPQNGEQSAVNAVVQNTLRVDAARIDSVMDLVGELIIGKSMLQRAIAEVGRLHGAEQHHARLVDALGFQSRVLDELHKCVLKIRMVPVEQLFRRFPRTVRDAARHCQRDVALEISGQNTDLDKGIVDVLAEPLTHLVRNAVAHGIESPEERIAEGKSARGTIFLNSYHQGTQVVVDVRDDGRGIDLELVRRKAIAQGLVSAEEAPRLSEPEVLDFIFQPGFSTASEVTEVSGRGVGLDVVRNVMGKLKGTVNVSSRPGRGATFQLRVPLTLASIHALLFRINGRPFAIPLSSVIEITRISEPEIHRVEHREVLQLRNQILTVVRLNRSGKIHAVEERKRLFVLVIGSADKKFGLLVDSLAGEEELVVKALPHDLVASDLVSGASVLGDGTVVLILDVSALLSRLSRNAALEAIA